MPQQEKSAFFTIIIIFAIAAFGAVGYQIFNLTLAQNIGEKKEKNEEPGTTGNVFKDMAINHPKAQMIKRRSQKSLQQSYNAVPFDHNITMGNPDAKVRLTIFTDIACAPCRKEVNQVLAKVPLTKTYVVFKHAATDVTNIKSGLFEQIARRAGILEHFHSAIYAQSTSASDAFMMSTLNQLGVPFKEQQELLKDEPGSITREIDQDLMQGDRAGIERIPTFFLDRYRMSKNTLSVEHIADFVNHLDKGGSIHEIAHTKQLEAKSLKAR